MLLSAHNNWVYFEWRWVAIDKIEEWLERNITFFVLPSYSPQLDLIEILWPLIKYEWIEIDTYKSWETFVASGEKILREFGKNYVINFVWLLNMRGASLVRVT